MAVHLTPNMEMYLKTILEIDLAGDEARVKMIADRLGVTMPSVSGAVDNLRRKGLVGHNPYGKVELTEEGRSVALKVKEQNDLLYRFLREVLGVPDRIAKEDACTLEHVVSRTTLNRLSRFLEFVQVCPLGPGDIVADFVKWVNDTDAARTDRSRASQQQERTAS